MGNLGNLLTDFDCIWEPLKQRSHEIVWTLRLNKESEKENFSLEKLQAFQKYLKEKGYFIDIGDDKIISVDNPQKINVQHNNVLYIY